MQSFHDIAQCDQLSHLLGQILLNYSHFQNSISKSFYKFLVLYCVGELASLYFQCVGGGVLVGTNLFVVSYAHHIWQAGPFERGVTDEE